MSDGHLWVVTIVDLRARLTSIYLEKDFHISVNKGLVSKYVSELTHESTDLCDQFHLWLYKSTINTHSSLEFKKYFRLVTVCFKLLADHILTLKVLLRFMRLGINKIRNLYVETHRSFLFTVCQCNEVAM